MSTHAQKMQAVRVLQATGARTGPLVQLAPSGPPTTTADVARQRVADAQAKVGAIQTSKRVVLDELKRLEQLSTHSLADMLAEHNARRELARFDSDEGKGAQVSAALELSEAEANLKAAETRREFNMTPEEGDALGFVVHPDCRGPEPMQSHAEKMRLHQRVMGGLAHSITARED